MNLRICVVIPCFNNGRTISELVKDVVTQTEFPVLVVDDGSDAPVSNVLYSWEVRKALEAGRVRVIRFEKNRGKGAALQEAIRDLVARGYTHMLTMDAGGHHHASEIAKLVEVARSDPWDLVLGERKLEQPEKPRRLRGFEKFWVQYETGQHIKDPRCGFRLYPLFPLQTMRFFANRYDFDLEVLIRLLWKGVVVREVPIDVPVRVEESHFRKFSDNARISTLNAILVVLSLFRTHRSPGQLAAALGLGVFVGCTPLFGFHWLIVIGLAFLFRLNVIITWLGTHVSTPVLAPFVVMAEVWIGRNWLHLAPENGAKGDFVQLLGGSLVLGIGLSLLTAAITYAVARSVQARKQGRIWGGQDGSKKHGLLKMVLKHFGLDGGYFCRLFATPFVYLFGFRTRRGLSEYWKITEPGLTWRERQARVLRQIHGFLRVETDCVFERMNPAFEGRIHGQELAKEGAICLSAHLGSPEMAIALLDRKGVHVLKPVLGDRVQGDSGELTPFFGRLALFDLSAFRNGKPLIAVSGFKGEDQTYDIYIKPLDTAEDYIRELERLTRQYPEQWFNFFPFWSSLP